MPTFSPEASARLEGPEWLRARRAQSVAAFASTPLPSESEEVWRYTPIDQLDLDQFTPETASDNGHGAALLESVAASLGTTAGTVLVESGRPVAFTRADGFAFGHAQDVVTAPEMLGSVQQDGDALVRLNGAFLPEAVFIDVPDGVTVESPVLVVHWSAGGAAFPRTVVRAGRGARVSVFEVYGGATGDERSLVVPVT